MTHLVTVVYGDHMPTFGTPCHQNSKRVGTTSRSSKQYARLQMLMNHVPLVISIFQTPSTNLNILRRTYY